MKLYLEQVLYQKHKLADSFQGSKMKNVEDGHPQTDENVERVQKLIWQERYLTSHYLWEKSLFMEDVNTF